MPIISQGAPPATGILPTSQAYGGNAGLPTEPSNEFALRAHPFSWSMDGEGGLFPCLDRLWKTPGLNNVDEHGDTSFAEAMSAKEGWRVIPLDACLATDTPDGRPGYLRGFHCRRGGTVWVTAWEHPEVLADRVVWHTDHAGYRAWLEALITRGTIAAPHSSVLEEKTQELVSQLQQAQAQAAFSPPAAARVEGIRKQLDGLKAYASGGATPVKTARK
jgi:hypothetical protein